MLGLKQGDIACSADKIIPAPCAKNLSAVSIECMLGDNDTPVIWRGPMKIGAIRQFISDVQWGGLDYLVIDSPPGTGDEPLTVAQTVAGAQAVIVTTPQNVSLRDVRKSINFCRQVNMNVLGLVENMSGFSCPACGTRTPLFKAGGGEKTARDMGVPFLGAIPIIPDVVTHCDNGVPAIKGSTALREAFTPILDAIASGHGVKKTPESTEEVSIKKEVAVMKIALPVAQGKLAMHFGHCETFALIDVDEKTKKILKQESVPAPEHQPGLLPAWLHEQGANIIIAGGMGSRAQSLFAQHGIRVEVGAPSEAPEKIVTDYLNGSLVTGGNICDH
jgi:predicted Fe-Mo cluster-binding NifX family protein/MinD-like ATPase involved in chromosome partitioning or flagellar assembly